MKFQLEDFDCGPGAVVNAARALGKKVSLERAVELAGTTEDGTDEKGIIKALSRLGFDVEEFESRFQSVAFRWLVAQLLQGRPVILCVEKSSHWAAAIGLLGGDRVVYVDSADYEQNKSENGVYVFSKRKLARLWKCRAEKGKASSYYGIAVRKKER